MESDGNELATRPQRVAGLAVPVPTAATYDTVTEGKTGWRFVLTRRWIAFVVGTLLYITGGTAGVLWQVGLSEQAAQFNATVARNFDAPVAPLSTVLSSLDAHPASEQWRPVSAVGVYVVAQQFYVRGRTCGSDIGFEVLTPLRLANGHLLIIDRGCVRASAANPVVPVFTALPPAGRVEVTARIVASEASKQSVDASQAAPAAGANQVDSIDLPQLAKRLDRPTYTGDYGMLVSQSPAPAKSLHPVLSGKPSVDASAQQGTIFGLVLYGLVGLGIFVFALREKFRFVNRFDPRLWRREWKRIQRLAKKPYTDAELEDIQIDGYSRSARPGLEVLPPPRNDVIEK